MNRFFVLFALFFGLLYSEEKENQETSKIDKSKNSRYQKIIDNPLLSIDFQKESQRLLKQNLSDIRFLRNTLLNHNMKDFVDSFVQSYIKGKELSVQEKYQESSFILSKNESLLKEKVQEIIAKYKKEISNQYKKIVNFTISFNLNQRKNKSLIQSIKKYENLYLEIRKQAQELEKSQSFYKALKFYKNALKQLYTIRILIEPSKAKPQNMVIKNLQKQANKILTLDEKLFWSDIKNEPYTEKTIKSSSQKQQEQQNSSEPNTKVEE